MIVVQDDPEHPGFIEPGLGIDTRVLSGLCFMKFIFRHGKRSFYPPEQSFYAGVSMKNGLAACESFFTGDVKLLLII
jgi:hypothetical protein